MSSAKHILFYSNFCAYCKNVLELIIEKKLREAFIFVCIEKHKAPQAVDRVPFIITSNKKNIYDDALLEFIQSLLMKEVECEDTVHALFPMDNDGYSFIEEDNKGSKKNHDLSTMLSYVYLDDEEKDDKAVPKPPPIPSSTPYSTRKAGMPSKIDESFYDSFIKNRSAEIRLE